ncbi:MAG: 4Fe-4S binding protein [Candidatus Aenigmarchaeota archaeon]|nr:4Fe-4S binding protein [Candidatus Aenigmarchaeota archaeon]
MMINENEVKYDVSKILPSVHAEKPSALRLRKPVIDLKRCDKTYRCVVYCPENAIKTGKDGFPSISYDKCDGCLICLRECPTTAIAEGQE